MKFATVSHSIYLLETKVSSAVANSCQTSAPRSQTKKSVQGFVAVSHAIYLLLHFVSHTVFLRIKDS
ncbi:hypothetical protein [Pilibacter termitis]|uniref:hypothetical protein n=1 Tax=Pilibacter termitis TaxID=263852 RepID=UPI001184D375|nr:hypothetical protein [Pilibacter termitis]